MNFLLIPLLFLLWRVFDFLIIFFSQKIIPYLGFFSYKDDLLLFNLPSWLYSLANFDGIHYIKIAKYGYSQYEQAFFPLYPLFIKFLSPFFLNNQLLTGLIISNVSFFLGLWILTKYLRLISIDLKKIKFILFFILIFPTSFYFGAVYTEGLFFLLVVSVLYFLKKNNYLLAVILAFLASLTRLMGVFLIIPIIFHWIMVSFSHPKGYRLRRESKRSWIPVFTGMTAIITLSAPILGLASYCFYLFKTTGDPFFFFSSQPVFGASRSTHLISFFQVYWRYFKIFFTATHNFQYFISVIEFSFFTFVFVVLLLDLIKNLTLLRTRKKFDLLGLNLFSLVNILLPTLTGTFLSIPRFSLISLSFFIYLAQIKNTYIKYLILGIFLIFHILLLGYFTQGYFIS